MTISKNRVHHLIDRLSDRELESLWPILSELYYDFYTLRAIQEAKEAVQPGDTMTREEALRFLRS